MFTSKGNHLIQDGDPWDRDTQDLDLHESMGVWILEGSGLSTYLQSEGLSGVWSTSDSHMYLPLLNTAFSTTTRGAIYLCSREEHSSEGGACIGWWMDQGSRDPEGLEIWRVWRSGGSGDPEGSRIHQSMKGGVIWIPNGLDTTRTTATRSIASL